jgi:hypothetical protein
MMRDPEQPRGDSEAAYVSHGYFDPLVARRILKRFEQDGVRFDVIDTSRLDMDDAGVVEYVTPLTRPPKLARLNRIELFVHREDEEKARKIIDEI